MDNGNGQFKEISNEMFEKKLETRDPMVFKVGEVLLIRGSRLRVEKILRNKLVLKLLPQNK